MARERIQNATKHSARGQLVSVRPFNLRGLVVGYFGVQNTCRDDLPTQNVVGMCTTIQMYGMDGSEHVGRFGQWKPGSSRRRNGAQ